MAQFYQKINTLYKRDAANKNAIIIGDYSLPEFKYLKNCVWDVTEKIDGTNMSYEIFFYGDGEIAAINIHGKTENANIPKDLLAVMESKMQELQDNGTFTEAFKRTSKDEDGNEVYTWPKKVTIFGEGYGAKIQGGGRYSASPKFIVFDITIENNNGEDVYLLHNNVKDICDKLGLDMVHYYGHMTIDDAESIIQTIARWVHSKNGNIKRSDIPDDMWEDEEFPYCMFSNNADDKNLVIEGFVLKSPLGLKTRAGAPLTLKIKVKDYVDLLKKGIDF